MTVSDIGYVIGYFASALFMVGACLLLARDVKRKLFKRNSEKDA